MLVDHETPRGPGDERIAFVRPPSKNASQTQGGGQGPQEGLQRTYSRQTSGSTSANLPRSNSSRGAAFALRGSPSMLRRSSSTGTSAAANGGPPPTGVASLTKTLSRTFSNQVHPGSIPLKFGITNEELLKFDGKLEEVNKHGGVQGIAHALRVTADQGIGGTVEEIKIRTEAFGPNTFPERKRKHFLRYVWESLQDETLLILIACAVVSLIVGLTTEDPKEGWYDGTGIGFAVICVVLVASISDWKQSIQFLELTAEKRKIFINCTREGRRCKVLIFEIVVGDIVHINVGDQIPGDGLLLDGHSLVIDESSMTGESEPMHKDAERPFMLSGCKVLDGFGTMVVTAVGMNTEWGKVMATLSEENDESTPLQARLDSLATTIGKIGLSIAVVVFIVLIIRFLATTDLKNFTGEDGREIVDFFAIAVTIVVVAVPEGLPLAVTLTYVGLLHAKNDERQSASSAVRSV